MRSYLNKSEMIFFVNMMTNWQKTSLKIVLLRSQQQSHHLKMISNLIPFSKYSYFGVLGFLRSKGNFIGSSTLSILMYILKKIASHGRLRIAFLLSSFVLQHTSTLIKCTLFGVKARSDQLRFETVLRLF